MLTLVCLFVFYHNHVCISEDAYTLTTSHFYLYILLSLSQEMMRLYLPPCYKKLELQVLFSLRRQMTMMLLLYRLAYRSLGPGMKLKAS